MTHQPVKIRTGITDGGLSLELLGTHVTGKTRVTGTIDKTIDKLRAEYSRPIRCNIGSKVSWIQKLSRTTQEGQVVGNKTELRTQ
jgi:hypothetical protein